jgi:tetratricopeptide (TPR) repeat protein
MESHAPVAAGKSRHRAVDAWVDREPICGSRAALHAYLGWAYAGLGEATSAIAEGEKAMAMWPASKDPFQGPAQEEYMAGIYALLGDGEHAIPILKRLLQIPYGFAITPAWLRLDPTWDQIRNDPRFQKLCEEKPKTLDK